MNKDSVPKEAGCQLSGAGKKVLCRKDHDQGDYGSWQG